MERSFADAKQLHGHRYARYRGLSRVQAQSLLAAACQNMKKMARLLAAFLRRYSVPMRGKGAVARCLAFITRTTDQFKRWSPELI